VESGERREGQWNGKKKATDKTAGEKGEGRGERQAVKGKGGLDCGGEGGGGAGRKVGGGRVYGVLKRRERRA